MKILITRPEPDASRLKEILAKLGHDIVLAPMMTITNLPGTQVSLDGVQALLVTSANGARALGLATAFRDVMVYAVGAATAETVRDEGFDKIVSADGDVPSLANKVIAECDPKKGKLVHIAGTEVAGDLSGLLKVAGFDCERAVLYEAKPAKTIAPEAVKLMKAGTIDAAVFYSPRTADIFCNTVKAAKLDVHMKSITAIALSDAVAKKISVLPWLKIQTAAEPNQESLLGQLETIRPKQAPEEITGKSEEQKVSDKKSEKTTTSPEPKKSPPTSAGTAAKNPAPAMASKPASTGSRTGFYLVSLLVVFCLGLAGWPLLYPKVQPYLSAATAEIISGQFGAAEGARDYSPEITALQTALKSDVAALSDRIKALEEQKTTPVAATSTNDVMPADNSKLTELSETTDQRLQELDAKLLEQLKQLETVVAQLDQQGGEISGLKEAEPIASRPDPEVQSEILDLKNELIDLKTRMNGLQSELALEQATVKTQATILSSIESSLKAEASDEAAEKAEDKRTLMLLALGQLQRETRSNEPFENGLAQVEAVANEGVNSELAVLKPLGSTGVATITELRQDFTKIATDISQTARLPSEETWYGQTLHRIASAVKFRRVDDLESTDVDAIVARAEQNLAQNNLGKAVAEVKKLDGAAADVAKVWLAKAEARLTVEQALAGLLASATSAAVSAPTSN